MRTTSPREKAVIIGKLFTFIVGILATLAMLLPQASIAQADDLDDLTKPTDIGDPANSVVIQLDKATKTFNITGTGTISKDKFNKVKFDKAVDYWDSTGGYYHDNIVTTIDPQNDSSDPLSQYTIHVAGTVHFPNDSSYLFANIKTKITIDPTINTGNVTNMSDMFYFARYANPDVSKWDVSHVTDMSWMFFEAVNANPDVSQWDTSKVTDMNNMFNYVDKANPDVSHWDVSHVTNMNGMFADTSKANPDVSHWDVSHVTNMSEMFFEATKANPDVSHWDVSKVTDMNYMFHATPKANPDVSHWDVSHVTNMESMFEGPTNANPDVSHWDVSHVTNMSYMFYGATKANPDISKWKISKTINTHRMFEGSAYKKPAKPEPSPAKPEPVSIHHSTNKMNTRHMNTTTTQSNLAQTGSSVLYPVMVVILLSMLGITIPIMRRYKAHK